MVDKESAEEVKEDDSLYGDMRKSENVDNRSIQSTHPEQSNGSLESARTESSLSRGHQNACKEFPVSSHLSPAASQSSQSVFVRRIPLKFRQTPKRTAQRAEK